MTQTAPRKELHYTVMTSNGDYVCYPASVVKSVQIETVYFYTRTKLNKAIQAIIDGVFKKIQPSIEECEKLKEYAIRAEKIYNNQSDAVREMINRKGREKYRDLQFKF